MKIKRLLGFVAIAVASVGILAACGKDALLRIRQWFE